MDRDNLILLILLAFFTPPASHGALAADTETTNKAFHYEEAEKEVPNSIAQYEKGEVTRYFKSQTGEEISADDCTDENPCIAVKYSNFTQTEKNKRVVLNQTAYGDNTAGGKKEFHWQQEADGRWTLEEGAGENGITYSYDESKKSQRVTGSNGTISSTDKVFIDLNGTNKGGAMYTNSAYSASAPGNIHADFIHNGTKNGTASTSRYGGGAIWKYTGRIGEIEGNFIGNYVYADKLTLMAQGGAILNAGQVSATNVGISIGKITGNFIGNNVYSKYKEASGGAFYNNVNETVGDITGHFIGNYAISSEDVAYGGAIYNYSASHLSNITGDFIGNYAIGNKDTFGGAISNYQASEIKNITGDFIGNYVKSTSGAASGGALFSKFKGSIGKINSDFINNYAVSNSGSAYGGAIHNGGGSTSNASSTGDIIGNFISNHASSASGSANGGAIYNTYGTLGNITGDFTGNYASSLSGSASGGAINNFLSGFIGNITGDFIDNYASAAQNAKGGAIYNTEKNIGEINGSFVNNYAVSQSGNAQGGAIYTDSKENIAGITGDFYNNSASGSAASGGGAIYQSYTYIPYINGNFVENYSKTTKGNVYGGAIYKTEKSIIDTINGSFIGNYVSGAALSTAGGGAIYNGYNSIGKIGTIDGNFIGNKAINDSYMAQGGAIYNAGTIEEITGDFLNNKATGYESYGGAIYNTGTIEKITGDFWKNTSDGSLDSLGGAIFNEGKLTMNSSFIDNKTNANGGSVYNQTSGIIQNKGDFWNNEAAKDGGAIYSRGELTMESSFYDNTSSENGGAIYNSGQAEINGNFMDNSAKNAGGAISNVIDTANNLSGTIKHTGQFKHNTADNIGGAIYNENEMTLTSSFYNNIAGVDGGALYNTGTITMEASFSGNHAGRNGGALYNAETGVIDLIGKNLYTNNTIGTDKNFNDIHNMGTININDGGILKMQGGISSKEGILNIKGGGSLYADEYNTIENAINVFDEGKIFVLGSNTLIVDNKMRLDEGGLLSLGKGAHVNISGNLTGSGLLKINIGDDDKGSFTTGFVTVDGDLEGDFHVILKAEEGMTTAPEAFKFLAAQNDDVEGTKSGFVIDRIVGSPYMWVEDYNYNGETEGSHWYARIKNSQTKPDPDNSDEKDDPNQDPEDPNQDPEDPNQDPEDPNQDPEDPNQDPEDPNQDPEDPSQDPEDPGQTPEDPATKPDRPNYPNYPKDDDDLVYAPEIPAYGALQQTAFEQSRYFERYLGDAMSFGEEKACQQICENLRVECEKDEAQCYKYQEYCTGPEEQRACHYAWAAADFSNVKLKSVADINGDIEGLTLGLDIYHEDHSKAGVFAGYRYGKYDINGIKKYTTESGSRIRDKSYFGGLYYRYANNRWNWLVMGYMGEHNFNVHTDDKIVTAKSSAMQYGMSTRLSRHFDLTDTTDIIPFGRISYGIIKFDNMRDNVGKTAQIDTLSYMEFEIGSKLRHKVLDKKYGASVYIQPSLIQNVGNGKYTRITGIDDKIQTFDNQTIGHIEAGFEMNINKDFSAYMNARYGFGTDYKVYGGSAGLRYQF